MQLTQLIQLMAEHNVAQAHDLVGVPLAEIHAMESHFNVKFPVTYIQFLHSCGRSAGHLGGWTAFYFDDLKEIAEEFDFQRAIAQSDELIASNTLLIAQFDTYFDYFLCDGQADPEVYRIRFSHEGTAHCERFAPSFTAYINQLILSASNDTKYIDPFYIDECGNMVADDLVTEVPLSE